MSENIPTYKFDAQISDNLDFEISRIEHKQTLLRVGQKPRRNNFYIIFLIEDGAGIYIIDFEQYDVIPHMMFCIAPGQVHFWELTTALRGWVILFKEDFLTKYLPYASIGFPEDFSIFNWDTYSGFFLSETYRGRFEMLSHVLNAEFQNQDLFRRELSIQSALLLVLVNAQRASVGEAQQINSASDRLVRDFVALVNTNYKQTQKVQDYAHHLSVSASHLSDTVSEVVGSPPQKIIHRRVVLEAKRLLIHTDLPASIITDMLGFSDASYFGRFFKREVGETTKSYRQKFR